MRLLHVGYDVPVVESAPRAPVAPGAPRAPNAIGIPIYDTGLGHSLSLSQNPLVFQHPFTMRLSGPTGSGKTMFFLNVIDIRN